MPCGWECGAELTAREMRSHFVTCPKRPGAVRMALMSFADVRKKYSEKTPDQSSTEKRGEVVKDFDFGA